jgi:hypothetical protein
MTWTRFSALTRRNVFIIVKHMNGNSSIGYCLSIVIIQDRRAYYIDSDCCDINAGRIRYGIFE